MASKASQIFESTNNFSMSKGQWSGQSGLIAWQDQYFSTFLLLGYTSCTNLFDFHLWRRDLRMPWISSSQQKMGCTCFLARSPAFFTLLRIASLFLSMQSIRVYTIKFSMEYAASVPGNTAVLLYLAWCLSKDNFQVAFVILSFSRWGYVVGLCTPEFIWPHSSISVCKKKCFDSIKH